MNSSGSKALFGAISVLGLSAASSAHAQAEGVAPARPQTADPSDIVVTARRVEERLQDVPISITVFNQDQLDDRNVSTAADLANYTPSLSANSRFGTDNTTFSIRGFFQELRTTASVAIYFADVVAPRGGGSTSGGDGAGPGYFFDLQNVQVLKGPQGTLFGRNTTGGAILLVPQRPKQEFDGYVEGTYGNHDERRVQGVINVPVSEKLSVRAGIDRRLRDGYLKNVSPSGPRDFANVDYLAARLSVLAELTPDLENYTIGSYLRSDHNGAIPKLTACFPGVVLTGPLSCDQLAREQGQGRFAVENSQADARQLLKQWQVINTTTWTASDNLTIKNILSYAQLESRSINEAFGTYWIAPPIFQGRSAGALAGSVVSFVPIRPAAGLNSNDQSTFVEELQFQGRMGDDKLTWQAGAYYEESRPDGFYGNQNPSSMTCSDPETLQCADVFGRLRGDEGRRGSVSRQLASTKFRNIGLYAQGTYALTDRLKFTAGARYTWDKTNSLAQKFVFRFPAPNDARAYCLSPAVGPTGPVALGGGAFSFANSIPLDQVDTACLQRLRQKSNAPTWTADLDFTPADNVLLYAKFSRGYRQGSTNPFGADGFETFDPEKVDTYELGAKTSWRGSMPGYFNVAGYYNDFTDQQVQLGFRSSTNAVAPNTAILNAGKSRIYGVEIEAGLRPLPGLNLSASYGYLNTRVQELTLPTLPIPGSLYDLPILTTQQGQRLPFSPKHKLSIAAQYTVPTSGDIGEISLGWTYSYTSTNIVTFASAAGRLPPVETVNYNVSWDSVMGSDFDVSAFVTNATDDLVYTAVNDQTTSGFVSKFIGEPRMYGLRVRYNF